MNKEELIKNIERELEYSYDLLNSEYSVITELEEIKGDKENRIFQSLKYYNFTDSGDLHYFVAKQLMIKSVGDYGYYCIQQSIENYLKAYLIFNKYSTYKDLKKHDLLKLLELCRKCNSKHPEFITSNYIELICKKFNPFNEFARYPIQGKRPKDGMYIIKYDTDIRILEYFIYKMKEIMPPNRDNHLFGDFFQPLFQCKLYHSDFFSNIYINNINTM